MKIKLELFGASRDFSDKEHLVLEVHNKASIEDLRNYCKKKLYGSPYWLRNYV